MLSLHQALPLVLASFLCISCDDSGISPFHTAPIERAMVNQGYTGAFAGETSHILTRPLPPALYLAPSRDVNISATYYVRYQQDHLGASEWYDRNLPHRINTKRLNQFDPQKKAAIFKLYKERADRGNALSMINTGACYLGGRGTSCDYQKAMEYFRRATEQQTDTSVHDIAHYNVLYTKLHDSKYTFHDCLKDFKKDVQNPNYSTYSYGEMLYLLHENKALGNARLNATIRDELRTHEDKDKTGSCCYVAALNYREGNMDERKDLNKALELYKKAASPEREYGGYPRAHLALANIYHFGLMGVEQDRKLSLEHYTKAAQLHDNLTEDDAHRRARTALAVHQLLSGEPGKTINISIDIDGRTLNNVTAGQLLEVTAEHDKTAAYNYGIYLLAHAKGKISEDILRKIQEGSNSGQGDIAACARIFAALYSANSSVSESDVLSLKGNTTPAAMTLLANCYATGTGVRRNMEEAIRLYQENQEHDPAARYNLALCLKYGIGTRQDIAAAERLRNIASQELQRAANH